MLRTYDHGRSIDHHMTGLVYKLHHHIHSHVAHSHRPGHNVSPTPAQPTSRAHRSVRVALEADACGSAEAGWSSPPRANGRQVGHRAGPSGGTGQRVRLLPRHTARGRRPTPRSSPLSLTPGPHGTEPTCPPQESQRPVRKYGTPHLLQLDCFSSWIFPSSSFVLVGCDRSTRQERRGQIFVGFTLTLKIVSLALFIRIRCFFSFFESFSFL